MRPGLQTQLLRAAFAYLLSVCEALDVEPEEIHVGQVHGYYEAAVQVSTAAEVDRLADALGIARESEAQGKTWLRRQEPWDDGAAVLPLARPFGDLYRADRLQVVAYNVL